MFTLNGKVTLSTRLINSRKTDAPYQKISLWRLDHWFYSRRKSLLGML